MFKKLSIVGSLAFLAACSSTPISDDYVNDVIIQKNTLATYTEVVGKKITPVDLLESNLALQLSNLDVIVKISNDVTQPIDSVVNFNIQYNTDKNEQETLQKYDAVMVAGTEISLDSGSISSHCDEKICITTQNISFPISTILLENSQQDGVKFVLQQTGSEQGQLETMIPGRYLTALFK